MESRSEGVPTDAAPGIDISRPPLGERAARALVDVVAAGDDRLERHYLELKGALDLKSSRDKAKLVKFILGAANRMPDKAATAFGGYAVMVIGVVDGQQVGVAPIEHLDIEKAVTPFIGTDGPKWDLIRLRVSDSINDVLVLIVEPPQWGQPAYSCRKDGDAGLVDGDVYVRGDGETRRAKSGDHTELARRAAVAAPTKVAFDVTIVGEVVPVALDNETSLESYIRAERQRLLDALPEPAPRTSSAPLDPEALKALLTASTSDAALDDPAQGTTAYSALQAALSQSAFLPNQMAASVVDAARFGAHMDAVLSTPEKRTEEEYRTQIDRWARKVRERWPQAVESLVGLRLASVAPRVENLEEVFLHDVELVVHLEGDVRGIKANYDGGDPDRSSLGLPRTPRPWGPARVDLGLGGYTFPAQPFDLAPSASWVPTVTWENTGSVTLKFDVGTLRPRGTYECQDSDLILVVDDPTHAPVRGTWQITARDHNKIYAGELSVPVGELLDLNSHLLSILEISADH